MIYFNSSTNTAWGIDHIGGGDASFNSIIAEDGSIYLGSRASQAIDRFHRHNLYRYDSLGQEIWGKEFKGVLDPHLVQTPLSIRRGGGLIALSSYEGVNEELNNVVTKIDANGAVEFSKYFPMQDTAFASYVIEDMLEGVYLIQNVFLNGSQQRYGVNIYKLDAALNYEWGKSFDVFPMLLNTLYLEARLNDQNNLEIALPFNQLSTVFLSIDSLGAVVSSMGVALTGSPAPKWDSEGNYLLFRPLTWNDSIQSFDRRFGVQKISQSDLDNFCGRFIPCVEGTSLPIVSCADFPWEVSDADTSFQTMPVSIIETSPFEFDDGCFSLPTPTPFFSLPDTICKNDCMTSLNLQNQFAHYVEWKVDGPQTDTLIQVDTFSFCPSIPGNYTIEQTILFLGCEDFYTQEVVVLDDLSDLLPTNIQVCDFPPYQLIPNEQSRVVSQYEWSDGSTDPIATIVESGRYDLTVSDDYCVANDSAWVTLLPDSLSDIGIILDAGSDTLVCEALAPYHLRPFSNFTNRFWLNNRPLQDSVFDITQKGVHVIKTELVGCEFFDTIQVDFMTCPANIHLPNIFTPNDDGVNDFLKPLGSDFDLLSIQVYNRWGGIVHQAFGSNAQWNGYINAQIAPSGIYLVQIKYINTRINRIEEQVWDVGVVY